MDVDTRHWIGGRRVGVGRARSPTSPPSTSSRSPRSPAAARHEIDGGGAGRAGGVRSLGRDAASRPCRGRCGRSPTASTSASRNSRRWRPRDNGALLRSHRRSVMPRVAHNFRFFADWLGELDGGGLEINGHREQVSWAPAGRDRGDHAVERPADAGHLADRARAGGRQHRGRQAAGVGAADRQPAGRHHQRGRPARTACSTWSRGSATRGGRGARGPPRTSPGSRSPARRRPAARSRRPRGGAPHAGLAGTGRQVPADRLRRRRPRPRGLHAVGQYDNAGQVCLAGTRLLVEEAIAEEFTARFIERAAALRQGDPRDDATGIGPNITRAHLERVDGFVRRAVAAGAQAAARRRRQPRPRRPVLPADPARRRAAGLGDPDRGSVRPGADRADVQRRGRGGGAGQRHQVRAGGHALHRRPGPRRSGCPARLRAGTVWVNCFFVRDLRAPFGGAGQSGIGREGGTWSFDFYCDVKNTVYAPQGWRAGGRRPASGQRRTANEETANE